MRLVTYEAAGTARLGVLHGDAVVDPTRVLRASRRREAEVPTGMVAFFEGGAEARARAEQALLLTDAAAEKGDVLSDEGHPTVLPQEEVRLRAPVPRPRRIRDYLAYTQHAKGSGLAVPPAFAAMPICYQGNVETVLGPDEPLLWPSYTAQLDSNSASSPPAADASPGSRFSTTSAPATSRCSR